MIRYTLKCDQEHVFESWFADATAFDALAVAGHLACPICGSTKVEKSLMAPSVRPARKAAEAQAQAAPPAAMPRQMLGGPPSEIEEAIKALRSHVEKNSDYVGDDFAREARRMHEGDVPERAIHGEARPEEARQLLEDGIPVMPLPFLAGRKTN